MTEAKQSKGTTYEQLGPLPDFFSFDTSAKECRRKRTLQPGQLRPKQQPLLTIIIPTFNRFSTFLPKLITSLILQDTLHQTQIIVVDDKSKQQPASFLGQFASYITYIRHDENTGPIGCWKTALPHILAPYTHLCDDDDELILRTAFQATTYLDQHPTLNMVYGNFMRNGTIVPAGEYHEHLYESGKHTLQGTGNCIFRTSSLLPIFFDGPRQEHQEDYVFLKKYCKDNQPHFSHIGITWCKYNIHEGSKSVQATRRANIERDAQQLLLRDPRIVGKPLPQHTITLRKSRTSTIRKRQHYNILWICNDNTANNPYNIVKGINKFTPHTAKLIQSKLNYITYPTNNTIMVWDITKAKFKKYIKQADIIHFNESVQTGLYPPEQHIQFKDGGSLNLFNLIDSSQKVFRHANGTYYRVNHKSINEWTTSHNVSTTASTPDLLDLGPNVHWLPQPIPHERPAYRFTTPTIAPNDTTGTTTPQDQQLSISHSPTNRRIKGTDLFLQVLTNEFPELEVILLEDLTHDECMETRRKCQIHYDQHSLGAYGVAALEALAIGQLCIVGLNKIEPYIPDHKFITTTGTYEGFRQSIQQAIDIVQSKDHLTYINEARDWLIKWHDYEKTILFLTSLYEHAGYWRD